MQQLQAAMTSSGSYSQQPLNSKPSWAEGTVGALAGGPQTSMQPSLRRTCKSYWLAYELCDNHTRCQVLKLVGALARTRHLPPPIQWTTAGMLTMKQSLTQD